MDNKDLLWKKRENGVLVAAHRGVKGANIIPNTCLAYENALQHGADMIEMDGVLSTDGIFFLSMMGKRSLCGGLKGISGRCPRRRLRDTPAKTS